MGDVLGQLGSVATLGSIGTLITVVYLWYFHQLKPTETVSHARLREDVADGAKWGKTYQRGLQRLLARIDGQVFGQGTLHKQHPWTSKSLSFCLALASAYPFASLLGLWLYAGVNTSGVAELLPEDASAASRALIAVLLAWMICWTWWSQKFEGTKLFVRLAIGFGPFLLANYMGLIPTGAVAFAGAGAVAFAFAGAVAVAVAGAGAFAIIWLQEKASQRGLMSLYYFCYFPIMLVAGVLAIVFAPEKIGPRSIFAFALLFMLLLPLVNALWDWLSLGFTRWALQWVLDMRKGRSRSLKHGSMILLSIADLFASVFFLTGLAFSMTVIVELANLRAMSTGGPPLLDLAGLFTRLRDNPGDVAVFWVYITLFSTFAPTLAHLLVMSTALFTVAMPKALRNWVRKAMDNGFTGDVRNQMLVAGYFSLRLVVAIALVIAALLLFSFVLWHYLPGLAEQLLFWCSELQQWINPTAAPVYEARPPLVRVIEV